ncbi:MAG: acyl-CoA dehydrogenase family protein [Candidatus Binatia bacterium]
MDFTFSENQNMIRDLARDILDKEVTPERLKLAQDDPSWCDRALWSTLAAAGLLGIVVPEALGGMGFGIAEACMLLHEIGRAVAPVPVLPAVVLGGLPVAMFGTDAQKREWLPPLAAGETMLTAALVDAGSSAPGMPATTARPNGSGWVLDGQKNFVPAVHLAQGILVPAATPAGAGVFLVHPEAAGVALTRHRTSTGEPWFTVKLSGVRVDQGTLLGGDASAGRETVCWMYERAVVAVCATQLGVSEKALEVTSNYVRERQQFGVPIGSFQAVQHRSADCFIDLAAMRWVTWRAVCKLARGVPAARETAVAKFWAAEGGSRIANAAQHLHGGIGVDIDYPIHRYFLWSKALELSLGGAASQLARLGQDMARTGPPEFA